MILERLRPRGELALRWDAYLDAAEKGDEVWVYFHGPHRFDPGVYAKGEITRLSFRRRKVFIKLREYSADRPLTDKVMSRRVADVVAPRFRQVFLFPEQWTVAAQCNVDAKATTCAARRCESCPTWRALPRIGVDANGPPVRLPSCCGFTAGYWVLPPRSYYHRKAGPQVHRTTELFLRFKTGEKRLAFPLALAIYDVLRAKKVDDFECIIPIPLSPAKAKRGEIHRTLLLARELGRLLSVPVHKFLTLTKAISKRHLRGEQGVTALQFEKKYYKALSASKKLANLNRVLIVDDVATEGSTLRCAVQRALDRNPKCKVYAATAGQMIVKAVVRRPEDLRR
jgi:predicted amidophosphoribosyltransferase